MIKNLARKQGRGGGALRLRYRAVKFILRALGNHRRFQAGVARSEWNRAQRRALRAPTVSEPAISMPSSLMAPPWEAARLDHHIPLLLLRFSHPPLIGTPHLDIISLDKPTPHAGHEDIAQGKTEPSTVPFLFR